VQPGTLEYSAYIVSLAGCRDCHGHDFSGAPLPGAAPDEPGAPNIAAGSYAAAWTEEEFVQTFRTGVTPTNRTLDSEKMPINAYKNMTDADLKAIYMYLQSISHDAEK
jgi:mono/diheme cytochrome c family protein